MTLRQPHTARRRARRRLLGVESLECRWALSSSVSGVVWNDWNHDGRRAKRDVEMRVADVTVRAVNEYGVQVAATQTDANGEYRLGNLYAGTYSLEFIPPDDTDFTWPDQRDDDKDSDVVSATGRTAPFTLAYQQALDDVDAGLYMPSGTASVHGQVWQDLNGDGRRTDDEPAISGAEVQLENVHGQKLLEINTDDQGWYHISGQYLIPATYVVDFHRPPRGAFEAPWEVSPPRVPQEPDPRRQSHASVVDGKTRAFDLVSRDDPEGAEPKLLNAGFYQLQQVQGLAWHDLDRNGRQDETEFGVMGIPVHLLDSQDRVLKETVTDAYGVYRFTVTPGVYSVEFVRGEGMSLTADNQGDDELDSDADPATGRTARFTVVAQDFVPSPMAGFFAPHGSASLAGRIWHDLNANGIQEADEPGLPGMNVDLYNAGLRPLWTTQTDADGRYTISGAMLLPTSHVLGLGLPETIRVSPRNVGSGVSSRADSDFQPSNALSPIVELPAAPAGQVRPSRLVDGGLFSGGRVEGQVFNDIHRLEYYSGQEPGVPDVRVRLLDARGQEVAAMVTDGLGSYRFDDILPGAGYQVEITAPSGTRFARPDVIGSGHIASSTVRADTGRSAPFDIRSATVVARPALLRGIADQSGFLGTVWRDRNGNGIRDPLEPGAAGVAVRAVGANGITVEGVTNADGQFALPDVPRGSYSLTATLPAGAIWSPLDRGADDDVDSDINRSNGYTAVHPLIDGQVDTSVSFGLYDGSFSHDAAASLRITEVAFIGHGNPEFVEVRNIGQEPLDLSGVSFTDGVLFEFATSRMPQLFPGEFAAIHGVDRPLLSRPNAAEIMIAGEYRGDLGRTERLTIRDADQQVIQSFRYDDDWFILMDDEYEPWTLTVLDEQASVDRYETKANWRPSSRRAGSPGFADPRLTPDPGAVVINEIMAKTTDGFNDVIELYNTTDRPIDISHWFLGDYADADDPDVHLRRYRIAPQTVLNSHEYLVLTRQTHFANRLDPGLNSEFGLSSFGESVHLIAADPFGNFLGYSDSVSFGGVETGVSYGRVPLSDGGVSFLPLVRPSLGGPNTEPLAGEVVIDQIMASPNEGDEYLRLVNTSDHDVFLASDDQLWSIEGGIRYDFLPEEAAFLAPGQQGILVPGDPDQFRADYGIGADVKVWGPFDGALNNGGEVVSLVRQGPDGRRLLVDRVTYNNEGSWPQSTGGALTRISTQVWGDEPTNWTVSDVAPGTHLGQGRFVRLQHGTLSAAFYGHDALGILVVTAAPGDADGDGHFDSRDLVMVFQAGRYRLPAPADWKEGDWNHDGYFNESDFVIAFQYGQYEAGAAAGASRHPLRPLTSHLRQDEPAERSERLEDIVAWSEFPLMSTVSRTSRFSAHPPRRQTHL